MATEYGLFSDESADWTADEAVEAGFYSPEEAEAALRDRYGPEDGLTVHAIEEAEEDVCDSCGESETMYHDCNGNPRCEVCDPPCPCCSDGGGPR